VPKAAFTAVSDVWLSVETASSFLEHDAITIAAARATQSSVVFFISTIKIVQQFYCLTRNITNSVPKVNPSQKSRIRASYSTIRDVNRINIWGNFTQIVEKSEDGKPVLSTGLP